MSRTPTSHDVDDHDARDLQRALTDLIRVYQFRDRDAVCCYDVSPGQSHALERLAVRGAMTMNEFASSLFLEKSSASRLADGLQRKGYVARRAHPDDKRSLQLELTARGRKLFEKIDRDLLEERREVLGELDPSHRKAVIRSIARLAEAAAERVDASGGICIRT
jgi:DNA-binding MarR family transcriptional regulator